MKTCNRIRERQIVKNWDENRLETRKTERRWQVAELGNEARNRERRHMTE